MTCRKHFADFSAEKLSIVDINTGEIKEVEVFIAILAASQKTYAEAVYSQESGNFIRANENAFLSFGGVTESIVPDNLKSGVIRPSKYEPDINFQYLSFVAHYNTIILPARSGKSKDKALVSGNGKNNLSESICSIKK